MNNRVLFAVLAMFLNASAWAVEIRTVAFSRDAAPIASAGVTELLLDAMSGPVIGPQGHLAFATAIYERIPPSSAKIKEGLLVYSPSDGLSLVASTLEAGPGNGALPRYYDFRSIVVNGRGNVALHEGSNSSHPGFFDEGIWVERAGALQLVARESESVPGFGNLQFGSCCDDWTFSHLTLNNSGQAAFRAWAHDFSDYFSGIWRVGTNGELELAVRSGVPAPGFSDGTVFKNVSGIRSIPLNDAGQIAFHASLGQPDEDLGEPSIWRADPTGDVQLVMREGQPAPDRTGEALFGLPRDTQFLGDGRIAFSGTLVGPNINSNNDRAVWREAVGGGFELVVQAGDTLDTPTGPTKISFPELRVVGGDRMGFAAQLGGAADRASGIFRENEDGALQLLVRSGDESPGTEPGVRFAELASWRFGVPPFAQGGDAFSFNNHGHVAFLARLTGDSINATNNFGIWAIGPNDELLKVIRLGDVLDIDDGPGEDLRIVKTLRFVPGLTDTQELTFVATFTNPAGIDHVGIFYARLNVVPEPNAVTLSLMTLLAMLRRPER